MFIHNEDVESTVMLEGVTRKILAHSENIMMVEVSLGKGIVLPKHAHVHEQVTYVIKGRLEFEVDGQKRIMKAGDSVYMGSNIEHMVVVLEDDALVVDVFTPQREDFLK